MAQAARPMTDTRLPTREELVDRARAMKPALRERLPAAREAATLPAATIQDFKDAGFFRASRGLGLGRRAHRRPAPQRQAPLPSDRATPG